MHVSVMQLKGSRVIVGSALAITKMITARLSRRKQHIVSRILSFRAFPTSALPPLQTGAVFSSLALSVPPA